MNLNELYNENKNPFQDVVDKVAAKEKQADAEHTKGLKDIADKFQSAEKKSSEEFSKKLRADEAKDTHCSDKCCGSDVKAEDCNCPPTCKHCDCNAIVSESQLDELTGWTQAAPKRAAPQPKKSTFAELIKKSDDKRSALQRQKDGGKKNWFAEEQGVAEDKAGWSIKGSAKPAPKGPAPSWRLNPDGTATDKNTGITYNRDGSVKAKEGVAEDNLQEVAPLIAAAARFIVPKVLQLMPRIGKILKSAPTVIGKAATKSAPAVGKAAQTGAEIVGRNAGAIGTGAGVYTALTTIADGLVGGVGEVYDDVTDAVNELTDKLGDALDTTTIASLAAAAVKYSIPIGIVLAMLYGGKKVIDKMISEQGVAEAAQAKTDDKLLAYYAQRKAEKQKTADRKEQRKQTQQQARDAFGNMFGGGNPADKLKIKEQGRFAGDTPVNLGDVIMKTTKSMQVGDTVMYLGQKAEVVAMSKDRKRARITIEKGMGGVTQDVNTSDLKQLGKGVAEGSVTKKPQPYNDPNWVKNLPKEKLDPIAGPKYKKDKKEQGVAESQFDPINDDDFYEYNVNTNKIVKRISGKHPIARQFSPMQKEWAGRDADHKIVKGMYAKQLKPTVDEKVSDYLPAPLVNKHSIVKGWRKARGLDEKAPPGDKAERMVKHIKKNYSKDGKLTPTEKSIAYATAWKAHNAGKV